MIVVSRAWIVLGPSLGEGAYGGISTRRGAHPCEALSLARVACWLW